MRKEKLFAIIVLNLILQTVLCQDQPEIVFNHLTIEDGLSNNHITGIVKDDKGFMWFSSQRGLNRYDGNNIKNYLYSDDSTTSNYFRQIHQLFLDKNGSIWLINSRNGIAKFNPVNEKFTPCLVNNNKAESENYQVSEKICEDNSGNLWFGSNQGLISINSNYDSVTIYRHNSADELSISDNFINAIYTDKNYRLWICTRNGLNLYDYTKKQFIRFYCDPGSNTEIENNNITTIMENSEGELFINSGHSGIYYLNISGFASEVQINFVSLPMPPEYTFNGRYAFDHTFSLESDGHIYVCDNNGLLKITPKQNMLYYQFAEFLKESSPKPIISSFQKNLFIAGNDGLILFDKQHEIFHAYTNDPYDNKSISTNKIISWYSDSSGIIWLGNSRGGVNYFDLNRKKFNYLQHHPKKTESLISNSVSAIIEMKNGDIYIGTPDGLNIYSNTTKKINRLTDIKIENILSLYETSDGNLWIGADKLAVYTPKNGKIKFFDADYPGFRYSPSGIITFSEDQNKKLWIGTFWPGLMQYDLKNKEFKYFSTINERNTGEKIDQILDIKEKQNGDVVFASTKGFYVINEDQQFIFQTLHEDMESAPQIFCMYIDAKDRIWFGTGNGLYLFNSNYKIHNQYKNAQNFNANIYEIVGDKKADLWISTSNGLMRFNPLLETINTYTTKDGLLWNEFNINSLCFSGDNIIYAGSEKGIVWFNPDSIKTNPSPAKVVFTRFEINNQEVATNEVINGQIVLNKSITYTDHVKINHKNNDFTIHFSAIDYSNPEHSIVEYKVLNLHEDWRKADTKEMYLRYIKIPAGNYEIIVRASNGQQTQQYDTAKLTLTILPAWWNTTLFKLILFLVLIVIIATWLKVRTYHIAQQKKTLESKVRERTKKLVELNKKLKDQKRDIELISKKLHEADQAKIRFFTNISHELKTPLTIMIGITEKVLNKIKKNSELFKELILVKENQHRLHRLINQLLHIRKIEMGSSRICLIKGNPIDFISTVADFFKPVAESRHIEYSIGHDHWFENYTPNKQWYYDPDKLEKILANLLSNAFKFTLPNGKIEIKTFIIDGLLAIQIKDNGKGIDADNLPYIFERFKSNNNVSSEGTGIGLSYIKDLINIYNGSITVKSTSHKTDKVNSGTEFTVVLPFQKQQFKDKNAVFPEEIEPWNFEYSKTEFHEAGQNNVLPAYKNEINIDEKPKLLLIEDNHTLRDYMVAEFKTMYHVLQAKDGLEGYQTAIKTLPDVIISDILMPRMNGIELCKMVKKDLRTSHIPVILLTAKDEDESQLAGYETGADAYILKPFSMEILQSLVKSTVNNRNTLLQLFSSQFSNALPGIKPEDSDDLFINKAIQILKENLSNSDFSFETFAQEMKMSKSSLHRKIKSLTGMTYSEFSSKVKFRIACQMLVTSNQTISQVGYSVGYTNLTNFSRDFKKHTGQRPSEFIKSHQTNENQEHV